MKHVYYRINILNNKYEAEFISAINKFTHFQIAQQLSNLGHIFIKTEEDRELLLPFVIKAFLTDDLLTNCPRTIVYNPEINRVKLI